MSTLTKTDSHQCEGETSGAAMRDERGFWAWVAECHAETVAEGEPEDPRAIAASLRSTWPLLSEECREAYRRMGETT